MHKETRPWVYILVQHGILSLSLTPSLSVFPSLSPSPLYTSFLYVRQWLNYGLCGIASFKNKNSIFWNIVTSMSWAIWTKWIETIKFVEWGSLYILLSLLKREDHIYKEFCSSSIQVSEMLEKDNICSYVFLIAIFIFYKIHGG